ncbi:MAG: hypothetical protein U0871_15335 [Gemmataceae bacterium]
MNDQLKHDTAVAAAHAVAELFPGCLIADERELALSACAQVVRAALDAYDHFRDAGSDARAVCVCDEACHVVDEPL